MSVTPRGHTPAMVLVSPRPLQRSDVPGGMAEVEGGAEVLALLRGDASTRPRFDPGLAGGLRAWLEDAAYGVVGSRGDLAAPLVLGPREVLPGERAESLPKLSTDSFSSGTGRRDGDGRNEEALLGRLVRTLFRQLV